ncbi:MAG: hypothetical protein RMJ87_04250 [Cytophagales bacterium]|nr:hypothetical protein [Bernardetiaceae bacterium]MDW8204221.1 hypothetical protein [Cytophagales bacterium]
MKYSRFIIYEEVEILYTDLSNATPQQGIEGLRQLRENCKVRPAKSVLSLLNVANARYNSELIAYAKEMSRDNKPHILASSICGFNDLTKLMLNSILLFSGRRDIKLFNTVEESLNWLLQQYRQANV